MPAEPVSQGAPALRLVPDGGSRRRDVDVLAEWALFMRATGSSENTVGTRLRSIHSLMRHAAVNDPLELTRAHVMAWLGRPIARHSRITYWASVRSFSEFLRRFDHDPGSNLTDGLPSPRQPAPVARPLDDETIAKLLALPLNDRHWVWVRLALYQGMRVHEVAALRGEDVDVLAGWLTITGKGEHTAVIPLHPVVAAIADAMPPAGYWFPSDHVEGPVRPETVSDAIRTALRSIGCSARPHQLRDTAATALQRRSRDLRLTQSFLRHRQIQTTVKYTAVSNTDLQAAVRAIDWQRPAETAGAAPALPDLAALHADQLRDLAGQLLAALAKRQNP